MKLGLFKKVCHKLSDYDQEYDNHTLQTNPPHREEEQQYTNNHNTSKDN